MIKWIRKILGLDQINESILKNNSETFELLKAIYHQIAPQNNLKFEKKLLKKVRNSINSFVVKNKKTSINFDKINEKEFKNKLPKIFLNKENQETISGTLSSIVGASTNVGITSAATYGLFRATANTETLMKLSSGGVASAVTNGGQISKQAGFIQHGSTMFTPMVVFQIASIATGQYYMNNISKQLNSIQEKLDELINLFHIERQAKLVKSFKFLTEYLNRKNFVIEDFMLIKSVISELTNIREEYFLMLEDSVSDILKNNTYTSINSLKEVKRKINDFEKSGFLFKMKTSLIADELFHLAKITEFHMNLCYQNPDINRVNVLAEQLELITKFNSENISFHKTNNLFISVKNDTLKWINRAEKKSLFNTSEVKLLKENFITQFENFITERDKKINSISLTYKNVIEPFQKEKTIILDNRKGNLDIYMEE
ncbi:hypothetical protein [Tenacibaculum xiamenense]|uniref:hypothetical protein n=1 Tax=Tenacibaculum xiamenense TaxID=1261553 RepID=UPI0038942AFA